MKLPLLYTLDELRFAFDCDNIITDFHAWHNKRFKCNPGELVRKQPPTQNSKSFAKLKRALERLEKTPCKELAKKLASRKKMSMEKLDIG